MDEGIRRKHGLTFQTLRRFYSLSNIIIVAFFIFFLKYFFESDLVFWGMEFHNLTPNRDNELY